MEDKQAASFKHFERQGSANYLGELMDFTFFILISAGRENYKIGP